MNGKALNELLVKIDRYRRKKSYTIFDDFYETDLWLMEELIRKEIILKS